MDLSWHALNSVLKEKNSITMKSKDLATHGFQKNSTHTHQNLLKLSPVSEGQPTPAKLRILFPAHLWVRELWPQIYFL